MTARSITLFIALPVLAIFVSGRAARQGPETKPEVRLSISVPQANFRLGQPIPVKIEITNTGKQDFFVGRYLDDGAYTSPSHISVVLLDASSGKGPNVEELSEFLTPRTVAKWWVAVAPGHFYGTEITLQKSTNELLKKPGHYLLQVHYISSGGATSAILNEDVPSYPVWRGQLDSNVVPIEILPAR